MTTTRLKHILLTYIGNDLESADPAYVREVLTDVCCCSMEEIRELQLDFLWPDKEGCA